MGAGADHLEPHDDAADGPPAGHDASEPRPATTDPDRSPPGQDPDPEPFDLGEGDVATRIAHAKQRHGLAGAVLAAGMFGIDQAVNGRKPREEAPIVVDAPGEPGDIDRDGIAVSLDGAGLHVAAPPLPRSTPIVAPPAAPTRRARWWGR
jgi:hypothetical protein